MENSIDWTGSPDDQAAKVGEYELSILKSSYAWYTVRRNGVLVFEDFERSIEDAKTACEKAYREHLNKKCYEI